MPVTIEIRRASDRFAERAEGRVTHHSLSFGADYDPERLSFGPMVCHDDHLLGAGRGFDTHRHADLEIVTWVVSGALEHVDSTGATHVVEAGSVAHLSAGSGVEHSERATDAGPARFVQVWLRPGPEGAERVEPSYAVRSVDQLATATGGEPVEVLEVEGSRLSVARLGAGGTTEIPAATRAHVFVATGALVRSSLAEPLTAGDAFWAVDEPSHAVTAAVPTELLVWTFAS